MLSIIKDLSQAIENIKLFQDEVLHSPDIKDRLSSVRAWYAWRDDPDDPWIFAPSKFIRYAHIDAKEYIAHSSDKMDGRLTEARLRNWFVTVEDRTPLSRDLNNALCEFLSRLDKKPNKIYRINILKSQHNP